MSTFTHESVRELVVEVRAMRKELHEVRVFITGGGDASKSLAVRMDRLEQDARRRDRVIGWVAMAAVTSVVLAFLKLLAPAMLH